MNDPGGPGRQIKLFGSNRPCHLHVLGSASQAPTRHRNHNGYLLTWYDTGLLFDPGEGVQRQMVIKEISASKVNHIFISHFHGDHCLGLPGLIMRLGLQEYTAPVHLYFPASGRRYLDALIGCCSYVLRVELVFHPISGPGPVLQTDTYAVEARPLQHAIDTVGFILQEKPKWRLDPEKLRAAGLLDSPLNRELLDKGSVVVDGRTVRREEVGKIDRGFKFGYLMDTRLFDGCEVFARDTDVLLAESTYLEAERDLAREHYHLCTTDAAGLAREGGTRKLILTHFSQKERDTSAFEEEARKVFEPTIAARDFDTFQV